MNVIDFPNPYVLREHRRCRTCRDLVLIFCCGGAECPRQGVYACSECRNAPVGSLKAVTDVVEAEGRTQLDLGGDAA